MVNINEMCLFNAHLIFVRVGYVVGTQYLYELGIYCRYSWTISKLNFFF